MPTKFMMSSSGKLCSRQDKQIVFPGYLLLINKLLAYRTHFLSITWLSYGCLVSNGSHTLFNFYKYENKSNKSAFLQVKSSYGFG